MLKLKGKGKGGLINPANNNDPPDPPTHRTFVQRMTLPGVVLKILQTMADRRQ